MNRRGFGLPLYLRRAVLCGMVTAGISMAADLVSFPSDTPEHQGMSRAALDAWKDRLAALKTTALLVIRHDKIVYEWYAEGHGPERKQGTASLAKAIVGGTSLMVALQDGRLRADDLASTYIPAWRNDPQKQRILIRHLATHTSGIEPALGQVPTSGSVTKAMRFVSKATREPRDRHPEKPWSLVPGCRSR